MNSCKTYVVDKGICEIFEYRQQREGHPIPAKVLCISIFDSDLPKEKFDIVTIIGSAAYESGNIEKCLDSCFSLLKQGGTPDVYGKFERSPLET